MAISRRSSGTTANTTSGKLIYHGSNLSTSAKQNKTQASQTKTNVTNVSAAIANSTQQTTTQTTTTKQQSTTDTSNKPALGSSQTVANTQDTTRSNIVGKDFTKSERAVDALLDILNDQKKNKNIDKLPNNTKEEQAAARPYDSTNLEPTTASKVNAKTYVRNTNLEDNKPVIIMSSEFLPLYEPNGSLSKVGSYLNLKQQSKILTLKTALTVLDSIPAAKNSFTSRKSDLSTQSKLKTTEYSNLLTNIYAIVNALDLRKKVTNQITIEDFLISTGFKQTDTTNFSQTKIWQQSLIELKKLFLASSPKLLGNTANPDNSSENSDPYALAGVENIVYDGKERIWINPFASFPTIDELIVASNLTANEKNVSRYKEKQYINLLEANPKPNVSDADKGNVPIFTDSMFAAYEGTGKDIALLHNIIGKEIQYSSYIIEKSQELTSKFGYTFSTENTNWSVWDSLIGRFKKNVLDINENPTGQGYSLSSFAQNLVRESADVAYNVLTFEKSFIENRDITPGVYYYLDNIFSTNDGKNFDSSKLEALSAKASNAYQTLQTIRNFSGFTKDNNNKLNSPIELLYLSDEDFGGIIGDVVSMYTTVIRESDSGLLRNETNPNLQAIKSGEFSKLTRDQNIGIRLPALICKTAAYPTEEYKGVSEKIKSLLFMFVMGKVAETVDKKSVNTGFYDQIQKNIANLLLTVDQGIQSTKLLQIRPIIEDSFFISGNTSITSTSEEFLSRNFSLDASTGLLKKIVDSMKKVYEKNIYRNDFTAYSRIPKTAFMFSYFDLILRLVASSTPENVLGKFVFKVPMDGSIFDLGGSTTTVDQTYLIVDTPTVGQMREYFEVAFFGVFLFPKKVITAGDYTSAEAATVHSALSTYETILNNISQKIYFAANSLTTNLKNILDFLNSLYGNDPSLSADQKKDLINLSMSEEQMIMSNYILSEYIDRTEASDSETKLRKIPEFADFPKNFTDFINIDDTSVVSFSLLKRYFKDNPELTQPKCGNKKLISVGIPPSLFRSLSSTTADLLRANRRSIVRLKVYKTDSLSPGIVYEPQKFLFDLNRFPTRCLKNWNVNYIQTLVNNQNNIDVPFFIPSKLYSSYQYSFVTNPNTNTVSNSFPAEIFGNGFPSDTERFQIYRNHITSFILEEYLRWFTDCQFDETRYYNYSQVTKEIGNILKQHSTFLSAVSNSPETSSREIGTSVPEPNQGQVVVEFTDVGKNKIYRVPTNNPDSLLNQTVVPTPTNSHVLAMDLTFRNYFMNETFINDIDQYMRRAMYPKKFDRVFNLLIDPDNFVVNRSESDASTFDSLEKSSTIVKIPSSSNYRHRDTLPEDVSLDEFYVTIEPYDYVES